jgi:hypothetical protein
MCLANDIRAVQRQNQEIEIISQRNGLGYTDVEKSILERLRIKIVKEPKALRMVDNKTFVFGQDRGGSMRVHAYCRHSQPNLYIGNGAEGGIGPLYRPRSDKKM